jgi:GDPmannose 4,6-dehydratase
MVNNKNPKEYVLASGETHLIKEFVEKAFKYANIEGFWHGKGMAEEFSVGKYSVEKHDLKSSVLVRINSEFYRPAEVELLIGDSSLVRKELGWEPKISFDKLVEEMVLFDIKDYEKLCIKNMS